MIKPIYALLLLMPFLLTSCTKPSKEQIAEAIKNDPSLLANAIKKNPEAFKEALQSAQNFLRAEHQREQQEAAEKEMEKRFNDPLQPKIDKRQVFRGSEKAPITIVEYTDFECPFCSRGAATIKEVLQKFDGKVKVTVKHLPLPFHKQAMPSAKYYEAIRIQKPQAAIAFHDAVFGNQGELGKDGEKFLEAEAKKLGISLPKLKKDLASAEVTKKIEDDMNEAKEFGFQGTPSFSVGGIPVRGALPPEEFAKIIERLLQKKN